VTTLKDIPVTTIDGVETTLGALDAEVLLVVNVASKCGLTPQYEGLEALHRKYADQGFAVCGFPANDFLGQEPGSEDEIVEFCRTTYDVTFPMFSKITVVGDGRHALYSGLIDQQPEASGNPDAHRERLHGFNIETTDPPEVLWNFEKFLIGRDGSAIGRFAPNCTVDDEIVVGAIESALAG
jgi:glutathione peroxidase